MLNSFPTLSNESSMKNIILVSVFFYFWLVSVAQLSSTSAALEVQFGAVLNRSSDNSTAIVLEAIRYSISQSQSSVTPHTISLNELQVDPQPEFALEPFAQLNEFTANPGRRLHAGIDGTIDGLAKYSLSNASIPFVSLYPELENPKFRYEIRTEFSAEVWASATADLLDRFGWRDVCLAFAFDEDHPELINVKSEFVELWLSQSNRSVDVVSSFDSKSSALGAADACSQRGRRAIVVISHVEAAHMFLSALWGERLYAMETIWVSPFDSSEISKFSSLPPALSSFYKPQRSSGFFTIQVSAGSSIYRDGLMNHLLQFFDEEEIENQEHAVITAHDTIRMVAATIKAMTNAGDDLSDPEAFMNRFKTNHLGFVGASGSFSFDENGDRDGFLEVINWKCNNTTSSSFAHLWSWSTNLGLHNTLNNLPSPAPATTLRFFNGGSDIPPNDTPPVLNIAIAYAKSIGILNQWEYAAQIAINHAIQDNILPGYSINLIVVNTQGQESVAVRGALEALNTVKPHAFIGATLNTETIALQYVLKGAQVPQIAPTASAEQLTRRDSNPFFMRPVPSEYDEAKAILSLMRKYDWSKVAIIVSDDDIGTGGSGALDRAFLGTNVTIMARQIIALPTNDDAVRQQLSVVKRSNARIVVCIMGLAGIPSILRIGTELNMFTPDYAWIMGGQARLIDTFTDTVSSLLVPGVLLIGRYEGEGATFDRLRADMIALPRSSYPYSGSVIGMTTGVGYVYDACMTVIEAAAAQRLEGIPISNGTRLYSSMNRVSFDGATGKVEYENGERVFSAVVVMYRGLNRTWTEFGRVQRANKSLNSYELNINSAPLFIGVTFIEYTSAEGLIMCIIAALLMLCALGSILIVVRFRENTLLRASSPVFLVMILIGIILSLAGPFLYAGAPDSVKCHLQIWFFILGFVIAYGSIVVKNFRLWRLWDMSTMKIVRITNWHLIAYSQVFVVPFLLFLILYSAADPPRPRISGNGLTCQTSSFTWYIVILGCVVIMLLFGAFVSFKIRTLPQLFNECKYISISTYNLTVCLALGVSLFTILGNISATAAYTAYSLSIICGYGGMWVIIFVPKFWIIFVTPERLKELESGNSGITRGTGSNSGPRTTVTLSDQSMGQRSKSRSSRSSGKGDSAASPRSSD